jgi:hypothetical protein
VVHRTQLLEVVEELTCLSLREKAVPLLVEAGAEASVAS